LELKVNCLESINALSTATSVSMMFSPLGSPISFCCYMIYRVLKKKTLAKR